MTHEDIREVEAEMDLGSITILMDDAPEWFRAPVVCPACSLPLTEDTHESVIVTRASGEIFRCTDFEGNVHEVPETQDDEPW